MGETRPGGPRGSYGLAPVFCVRAAGIPFDRLAGLASPELVAAARAAIAAEDDLERAAAEAHATARKTIDDKQAQRGVLHRLTRQQKPSDELLASYPWLAPYARAHAAAAHAREAADRAAEAAGLPVHREIRSQALAVLPDFLVIESAAMLEEIRGLATHDDATALRSSDRETDRALAMYMQRVCCKGDTISKFGPSGWGRVTAGGALAIDPVRGIAAKHIQIERWVVAMLIDVIDGDPDVRAEVCPRIAPDAILDELAPDDRALAARCDGRTPAHQLGEPAALAHLAERGAVVWRLEKYASDVSPMASLVAEVEAWRAPVRDRWLPRLGRLRELAAAFGATDVLAERGAILERFRHALTELGVVPRERGRTLYAAANPISENCYRDYRFELGRGVVDQLIGDATPWFDLFGDAYALAVARAFELYRGLAAEAPHRAGKLSYAALAAHARLRGIEIEADKALVRVGQETFVEIKRLLAAALEERAARSGCDEIELTEADCRLLRARHDLPPITEFVCPQADIQLAAADPAAVAAGNYRWVIAELHHAFMPLQHALYWSCPDKPALHAAMEAVVGRPFAVRGALTEQPVHNGGESVFAALPGATFVHAGRPKPGWRAVRPAEAEVVIDPAARDIRLRGPDGADLGSLVRCFRIMMGMHPFFPFERAPHAPRLRMGKTIVQRRTWHVSSRELGEHRPSGTSAPFVMAVERMRGERGVPRWVFVRPTSESLRSHEKLRMQDLYARDKDLKPFYCDLESALFLDILERRLRKYGELVMSEMLPSPDELVWGGPDGRFVFELRTSVVPA